MDDLKKKKRQKRRKITGAVICLLLAAGLAALPFLLEQSQQESSGASILSGRVETGSIEKTVSGAGTLAAQEGTAVELPDGVKITRYLVSNGDITAEGQQIAAVDRNSVLLAMSKVQDAIDEIEEQMADCRDETLDTVICSNVRGTVSAVYAEKGDEVSAVMTEHGALAAVTLADGRQINITGVDGTVTNVNIREGGTVFVGAKCFYLENTSSTGLYSVLLGEHRDYEELMVKLAGMYVTGAIEAPCAGAVSGIDEAAAKELEKNVKVIYAAAASYKVIGIDGNEYEVEDDNVAESFTAYVTSVESGKIDFVRTDTYASDSLVSSAPCKAGDFIKVTYLYNPQTGKFDAGPSIEVVGHAEPKNNNTPGGGSGGGGTGSISVGRGVSTGGFTMATGTAATAEASRYPLVGSTLMTVTPQEKVSVSITVDEMDILRVNIGDEAAVTVDALPGRTFGGTVTERSTSPTNSGGNSKYSAVVTLDRQENMLDGMNASVLITFSRSDGLLLIPAEAVSEENGKSVVYTGYDETEKTLIGPVAVTTGLSDGDRVEIISGLKLNDSFYYEYYDTLEIDSILNGGGVNHAHSDN